MYSITYVYAVGIHNQMMGNKATQISSPMSLHVITGATADNFCNCEGGYSQTEITLIYFT